MAYFKKLMQVILLSVFLVVSVGAMAKTLTITVDNQSGLDIQLRAMGGGAGWIPCHTPLSPDRVPSYKKSLVKLTFSDKRLICKNTIHVLVTSSTPNTWTDLMCIPKPRFTRKMSGGKITVTNDDPQIGFHCEQTS